MNTESARHLENAEPAAKPMLLIADDSRVIRFSLKKILRDEFEIVEAVDGEEAWFKLQETPEIQAVFSDLSMPNLDGYGLLERVRASDDERIRALPFIVITAKDGELDELLAEVKARGGTDLVSKPFRSAEIVERTRQFLAETEAESAEAQQQAEKAARVRAEQERAAAEQAEQERLAAEKAEQARLVAERLEQERLATEQAEQEQLAAEHAAEASAAAEVLEPEALEFEGSDQEGMAAEPVESEGPAGEALDSEGWDFQWSEQEGAAAESLESEGSTPEQLEPAALDFQWSEQEEPEAESAEANGLALEQSDQDVSWAGQTDLTMDWGEQEEALPAWAGQGGAELVDQSDSLSAPDPFPTVEDEVDLGAVAEAPWETEGAAPAPLEPQDLSGEGPVADGADAGMSPQADEVEVESLEGSVKLTQDELIHIKALQEKARQFAEEKARREAVENLSSLQRFLLRLALPFMQVANKVLRLKKDEKLENLRRGLRG